MPAFLSVLCACDRDRGEQVLGPAAANAAPPVTATLGSVELPKPQTPEFTQLVAPTRDPIQLDLRCPAVTTAPVIDGVNDDSAWASAPEIITPDYSSQRPIAIRAVHTADMIYFLVRYPDAAASTTHKSWLWDPQELVYKAMGDREDMLVMKFSMVGSDVNLSFRGDTEPHRADIWFWKACRTNQSGYADDKWQALLTEGKDDTVAVPSPRFGQLHLTRQGDAGKPAYKDTMPLEYQGDLVPGFVRQPPQGSRADISATGRWIDGYWTIELSRALNTGHDDDVQFEVGGTYLFGLSCYEMAYSPVDPKCYQPIYKTGDVFDRLVLRVE